MSDTVDAVVTRSRGLSHRSVHQPSGKVLLGVPQNQFDDWNKLGWVERATEEQIAAARAEAEAAEKAEQSARAKPAKKAATTPSAGGTDKPA